MPAKDEAVLLPLNLSKSQVAQLAGLGVRTIERLSSMKVLRAFRPAGLRCTRYSRDEVLEWIAKGCPVPARRR